MEGLAGADPLTACFRTILPASPRGLVVMELTTATAAKLVCPWWTIAHEPPALNTLPSHLQVATHSLSQALSS